MNKIEEIINLSSKFDVRSSGVETRINFAFILLLILFINCKMNAVVLNKDSLKSKYDINDPRNPNCPCHKYQKIADEEYEKWLRQQSKEQGIAISKLDTREDKLKRKSIFSFTKHKAKRKNKAHPKFKKLLDMKRYKFWNRVTNTTACFKW